MSAKADNKLTTGSKLGTLHRSFELNRSTFNKEKRTVRVRFSSEAPVKRWFGEEILDHAPSSVDMMRMKNGAAVLLEHDTNQRIGITEWAEITADKTGEAEVRFARNTLGEQAMTEVEDGTLRWISVGYRVNKFLVDEDEESYRAVSWEPLEVSFVSIPADPSARVFRGANKEEEHEIEVMHKRNTPLLDPAPTGGNGSATPAAPAVVTQADFSRELDEAREILAVGAQFQRTHPQVSEMVEKAIKDKTPLAKFQRSVMELISTKPAENISAPEFGKGQAPAFRGVKSTGQRFTESELYKRAVKSGSISEKRRISVEIPDEYSFRCMDHMAAIQHRTTFSAGTESINGTSGANIQVLPGIPGLLNQQPLYIADLFAQGATGADTIRYIQEQTFTNSATRVAEGAAKPEASLDVGIVNATVEKTAVWLKVTDEMLSDFQQMQSFINNRLGYMVQALEDQQLLSGSGSSQIKGVLNFTGLQTLAAAGAPIDGIGKAIEYVRGANGSGFAQPDAIVMHPLDWLNIKLSKDSNGQYLFGGPAYAPYGVGGYSNVSQMWGLPVVATTSMTRGTALVGAFRNAGQIWRRMGLTIDSTNSDSDDFQKNLITIRAEQRMALTIYQPNKFCTVTGIPA